MQKDLKVAIHGGYGIGKRNVEGKMLLDLCVQKELCVANMWYKKRDGSGRK